MIYKFQMENGIIQDGYNEIEIKDHIAEIEEPIIEAMKIVIEAHGGLPVEEKSKPRKGQRKVKPVKWETEIKEVSDDSTSS